jgi:hypothetical protein
MKLRDVTMLSLTLVLSASIVLAEEGKTVKSGPQKGEELAGPFHPLNINGKKAGEKNCLYCENGNAPVAMIFARDVSPELTSLITKIDTCTAKNNSCKMGSFVVFCSNDEALEGKLKKLAKDKDLKKTVLSIDNPAGPEKYNVSKDADITVVLYVDRTVKENFAFKKGEMKDGDVEKIIKAVPSILPSDK